MGWLADRRNEPHASDAESATVTVVDTVTVGWAVDVAVMVYCPGPGVTQSPLAEMLRQTLTG